MIPKVLAPALKILELCGHWYLGCLTSRSRAMADWTMQTSDSFGPIRPSSRMGWVLLGGMCGPGCGRRPRGSPGGALRREMGIYRTLPLPQHSFPNLVGKSNHFTLGGWGTPSCTGSSLGGTARQAARPPPSRVAETLAWPPGSLPGRGLQRGRKWRSQAAGDAVPGNSWVRSTL